MFISHVSPRFSETDALGHINNAAVPIWFEEGRLPIFQIFNPTLKISTWNLILKKLDVEFDAQLFYGTDVVVETSVVRLGNSSFDLQQVAKQNRVAAASCRAVLIHFNYETQRPEPIPAAIRTQLQAEMTEQSGG